MDVVFESDSISFARVSEDLIPDYLALLNDYERVGRFISANDREYTAEGEVSWVRRKLAENEQVFSMLEKPCGAFIGNIELMDVRDADGELGIAITAARQDRGYGTEAIRRLLDYAFTDLKLERVWLKVYPDNTRAIHVYERCGFREYDRTNDDVFMEIVR